MDIGSWLRDQGLEQYVSAFAENDIDVDLLPSLDADDLKELGVKSLGHRKRLLAAAAAVGGQVVPPGQPPAPVAQAESVAPINYVPKHLAQRIIESRYALEGERKQVTVLFADIKGSMALIAGTDPDFAAQMIDPAVEAMMSAVHRFDGTVNRVQGDGIMALFGAPIAQEDHALRACYAALSIRSALAELSQRSRRTIGVDLEVRVGLNSGEVVVRAIKNDLTINYDAMGETAHLASRMEQLAPTGQIRIADATYKLVRDFVSVEELGPLPVKGMDQPVEAYQLIAANSIRTRIQAAAATGFSRFVGRQHELTILTEAFDATGTDTGRLIGIVGEPGVGKSRLYYEFAQSPRMQQRLVLSAGTVSHGRASAHLPIADLLRQYFDINPEDDPRKIHEKALGRLLTLDEGLRYTLPALLFVLDAPVADAAWDVLDPSGRREHIRDSVRALFLRQSQQQPVVLLLEDLHWFDSESLGVLDSLIGCLGHAPLLMLTNFRPEFSETWSSRALYTRVRLEPLGAESMHDLLEYLLGPASELSGLKRALVERTEGNPLFIEESVHALTETGVLTGSRGGYTLTQDSAEIQIPSSIQSVIAARMDRLEPDIKHLLQCAAVIGKDFSFALLVAVTDLEEGDVEAGLGTLRDAEFIYEVKLFPEKEYTFKHALTHQVTYGSLVSHRRIELHTRALSVAEQRWSAPTNEQLQMLARHASAGEMWEKASDYGRAAGGRLAEHNATRPASIAFEIALEALTKLDYSEERARVRIELNFRLRDLYFILGDFDRIPPRLEEAAELCEQVGDRELLCWSTLQHSGFCWQSGQLTQAIDAASSAVALSKALDDASLRALSFYRLGIALTGLGRFREAADALLSSLEWLDTDAGREYFQLGGLPFCFSCSFLAWALSELGELEQAQYWGWRGYEHAAAEGQGYSQCVAAFGLGHALLHSGCADDARPVLERAYELALSGEALSTVPWLGGFLGQYYARNGEAERAREIIAESRRVQGPAHGFSAWLRGNALASLGDVADAREELHAAQAVCEEHHEAATVAWTECLLHELALDADVAASVTGITAIRDHANGQGWMLLARHCDAVLART